MFPSLAFLSSGRLRGLCLYCGPPLHLSRCTEIIKDGAILRTSLTHPLVLMGFQGGGNIEDLSYTSLNVHCTGAFKEKAILRISLTSPLMLRGFQGEAHIEDLPYPYTSHSVQGS